MSEYTSRGSMSDTSSIHRWHQHRNETTRTGGGCKLTRDSLYSNCRELRRHEPPLCMRRQLPNGRFQAFLHDGHELGQHLVPVHQEVLCNPVKLWENQRTLWLLHGGGKAGFQVRLEQCGEGVQRRACEGEVLGGDGAQATGLHGAGTQNKLARSGIEHLYEQPW